MAVIYTDRKSELPKRHEMDHYRTPEEFADLGLRALWRVIARSDPFGAAPNPGWAPSVLDPGAGDGVWGSALRRYYTPRVLVGVEAREVARPEAYDQWYVADFLQLTEGYERIAGAEGYGLVIGNPPYAQAEAFIRAAQKVLAPGGYLLFLLKLTFLQSKKRAGGLFREWPPVEVAVCQKRPPFTGAGNPDSFAFYCWQKGYTGETRLTWV